MPRSVVKMNAIKKFRVNIVVCSCKPSFQITWSFFLTKNHAFHTRAYMEFQISRVFLHLKMVSDRSPTVNKKRFNLHLQIH